MSQIDFSKFKDFMEVDNIDTVKSKVDAGWQLLGVSSGTYDIDNEKRAYFLYSLGHTEKQPLPNLKFRFGSES